MAGGTFGCALHRDLVRDGGWVQEPKHDGIRALAVRRGERRVLLTREWLPVCRPFPSWVEAIPFDTDGELLRDGRYLVWDVPGAAGGLVQRRSVAASAGLPLVPLVHGEVTIDELQAIDPTIEGVVCKYIRAQWAWTRHSGAVISDWIKFKAA
jgi:ATP-dependent DNA ligase